MNRERLIFIREFLEMNQRKMASFLNVSKSNYARWETKETIIPLKYLLKICNKTHFSLDYVLGLKDGKEKICIQLKYDKIRIGKNIRKLRYQHHLSQKEFASTISTTQSVISNYENGKTKIQTAFLYEICLKYKTSADTLITQDPMETYYA